MIVSNSYSFDYVSSTLSWSRSNLSLSSSRSFLTRQLAAYPLFLSVLFFCLIFSTLPLGNPNIFKVNTNLCYLIGDSFKINIKINLAKLDCGLDQSQTVMVGEATTVVHKGYFYPRTLELRDGEGWWGRMRDGEGWSHNYSHKHTHTKPFRVNFVFGPISAHRARTWK